MTLTDIALLGFITLLLLYAIYDEFIMNQRKGRTLLRIDLLPRSRADNVIFIGLIAILVYNNITHNGTRLTTTLLLFLALTAIYLAWIRKPKLLFKEAGLFYANAWVDYTRIKEMNLSEDGVLVFQLEQRRLLIRVKSADDLEKIYNFMIERQ